MYWRFLRTISDFFETSPLFYTTIQKIRYFRKENKFNRIVSSSSIIMIEGYPRCANSFAVRAFRKNNEIGSVFKTATHLHSHAHVLRGLYLDIPTLVLIREPDFAILSRLAHIIEANEICYNSFPKDDNHQLLALTRYWTKRYYKFYSSLLTYKNNFVIADFREVVNNFDAIIDKINSFYDTKFNHFNHTQENVDLIFKSTGKHLSPSSRRNSIKDYFHNYYYSSINSFDRERANSIYRSFLK
jgi:hypothetical protein